MKIIPESSALHQRSAREFQSEGEKPHRTHKIRMSSSSTTRMLLDRAGAPGVPLRDPNTPVLSPPTRDKNHLIS
jgi:hypothetical protein